MPDATGRERRAKAAGLHPFAGDHVPPGALHGAVARAPLAHADIVAVDVAAARREHGVVAVYTSADIPGSVRVGTIQPDQRVLAEGRIRHAGEPIAFVVAETAAAARRGAAAVVLDLAPRRPIVDAAEAAAHLPEGDDDEPGTLLARHVVRRGDASAPTAVVVEGTWATGRQDPAFLAPEAAVAEPWGGGVRLTVATQDVHGDRTDVAAVLGIEPELVQVRDGGVGGAFGGREEMTLQPLVALAALRLGRPVRSAVSSAESLLAHPTRHPSRSEVRIGADADGTLRTLRARVVLDGGPYLTTSRSVARIVAYAMGGPYRFDAVDVEVRVGRTTNPTSGALRGFGATQACFALESTLDLLAARLGLDPTALRLANAAGPADRLATSGQPLGPAAPVEEIIRTARDHPLPDLPPPAPGARRATALAVGLKHCLRGDGRVEESWAAAELTPDGLLVETAAVDVGQGLRTVVERVVHEALGPVPVTLSTARTDLAPTGSTSASRQTWLVSGAVLACCAALRAGLGDATGAPEVRLDGTDVVTGPDRTPLDQVLARTPIGRVERRYAAPPTRAGDPHDGTGDAVHVAFMHSAHRATVDLAPDGSVAVRHVVAVHDAGHVVDPLSARRQVEGGVIQGIGFALFEEQVLDADGVPAAAPGWAGYPVPVLDEVPPIDVVFVESHEPGHPLGVKGLGEAPLIASPTAVALAVGRARGVPVTSIPLAPGARPGWLDEVVDA
ncbi:molybdopterin-dependent oxidoreductase [Iamia sp. SCSIO 61187]|uniref:xanthine dehydrogenase family protein molybdopterin-binding subunit n=1 Tax=Iamia sp. SCSIO 61187 TaxID=2722752 RepID=UPI001C628F43|nr:molybdopterin cofactor-binding domain-containing protein [Iamia sp. SCSIO 61187]QYG94048.1 molybdopterin-dependent oxidoreductase [Iamia sp. SCSIO 61187]